MKHSFQIVGAESGKSSFGCNVGNDDGFELAFGDVLERSMNSHRLLLRSSRRQDGMSALKEDIDHMAGDETRSA